MLYFIFFTGIQWARSESLLLQFWLSGLMFDIKHLLALNSRNYLTPESLVPFIFAIWVFETSTSDVANMIQIKIKGLDTNLHQMIDR